MGSHHRDGGFPLAIRPIAHKGRPSGPNNPGPRPGCGSCPDPVTPASIPQFGSENAARAMARNAGSPISWIMRSASSRGFSATTSASRYPAAQGDQTVDLEDPNGDGIFTIKPGQVLCARAGNLFLLYNVTVGASTQSFSVPLGTVTLIDPRGVVYDQAKFATKRIFGFQRGVGDVFVRVRVVVVRARCGCGVPWVATGARLQLPHHEWPTTRNGAPLADRFSGCFGRDRARVAGPACPAPGATGTRRARHPALPGSETYTWER